MENLQSSFLWQFVSEDWELLGGMGINLQFSSLKSRPWLMRGNFTLRASISPSNYINSPMLHHQNWSVLANSYQADRHVLSHLTLSVTIRAWWHEKCQNWSERSKWELNEQVNGSQSIIIWSDEEIFARPLMLSTACQKSGWVFINQEKPLTFSWLPLLTGGGNVDSWCINAERSWMRPTKTGFF